MDKKAFEFHGKAGGYFVVFLVTMVCSYIPILGWPIAMNYGLSWIADNATINGKNVKYEAGYGETLGFILVNMLLIIVTLGIYSFWFVPKSYRFVADHLKFV
ncbi:MAG TPA: DUF898 family protein [Candidatus Saccharimonadales bacterium]